jgi:hypothetical protein
MFRAWFRFMLRIEPLAGFSKGTVPAISLLASRPSAQREGGGSRGGGKEREEPLPSSHKAHSRRDAAVAGRASPW